LRGPPKPESRPTWRELFKRNQSLEWFQADGFFWLEKIYRLDFALEQKPPGGYQQRGQTRTLTIAVYMITSTKKRCNYKAIFEPPGKWNRSVDETLGLF